MSEIRTSELTDSLDNEFDRTLSVKDKVLSFIKKTINTIRRLFAASNEKSIVATAIEAVYFALLSCKARVFATFLFSFSTVSLIFCYIINADFNYFISDINTYYSEMILLISLVLFTCRVSLHELFSTSKILSKLSFIYNQHNTLFNISSERLYFEFSYSTAFFVGIISGIISAVYTVGAIAGFVISLIFIIFILNRPESGLLTTLFLIPFIEVNTLIAYLLVTFFSYIYKFLIGKRHLDFGITALLLVLSMVYMCTKQTGAIDSHEVKTLFCYIAFFSSCLFLINLIRTTAMFRRTLGVLIRMTRIYSIMLLLYIISKLFFTDESIGAFIINLNLESVEASLINHNFILPFLAAAIPLNFSVLISSKRKQDFALSLLFFFILSFCSLFVATLSFIIIVLLSCITILAVSNKKFLFFAIPVPVFSYLLFKLINKVPSISDSMGLQKFSSINENNLFSIDYGETISNSFSQNAFSQLLSNAGVVGIIIFTLIILVMLIRSFKSISKRYVNSEKLRILSSGLLCAVFSLIALSFLTNTLTDFRIAYMFAGILSLSYTAVKCYDSDYIDESTIREYTN